MILLRLLKSTFCLHRLNPSPCWLSCNHLLRCEFTFYHSVEIGLSRLEDLVDFASCLDEILAGRLAQTHDGGQCLLLGERGVRSTGKKSIFCFSVPERNVHPVRDGARLVGIRPRWATHTLVRISLAAEGAGYRLISRWFGTLGHAICQTDSEYATKPEYMNLQ